MRTATIWHFLTHESGATTVDWVVLCAACIGLTLAMLSTMDGATSSVAAQIETVLTSVEVAAIGPVGSDGNN